MISIHTPSRITTKYPSHLLRYSRSCAPHSIPARPGPWVLTPVLVAPNGFPTALPFAALTDLTMSYCTQQPRF
ncbi:hypothetical protein BC826DRAFT_1028485 [Russula brevipes]|nr:hypothetical protein BC826DRAFT_1028485 [Russula brevipes]